MAKIIGIIFIFIGVAYGYLVKRSYKIAASYYRYPMEDKMTKEFHAVDRSGQSFGSVRAESHEHAKRKMKKELPRDAKEKWEKSGAATLTESIQTEKQWAETVKAVEQRAGMCD